MRAALRTVLRGPLWRCAVLVASFLLAYAVWPHPVRYTAAPGTPDPVSIAMSEHDCGEAAPSRTLLLVRVRGGQVALLADRTGERDGGDEQVDWLYDQHAEFYGWCTP